MDPIHLTEDQLDYELAIRGMYNLSHRRIKQSKLREFLLAESKNNNQLPESNTSVIDESEDFQTLFEIYEEICGNVQVMFENRSTVGVDESRSKLIHLKFRIARFGVDENNRDDVYDLAKNVRTLLKEIEEYHKQIVELKKLKEVPKQVFGPGKNNVSKLLFNGQPFPSEQSKSPLGAASLSNNSKSSSEAAKKKLLETMVELSELSDTERQNVLYELSSLSLNPNAVEFGPS